MDGEDQKTFADLHSDPTYQRTQLERAEALYPDAMIWFEWACPLYASNSIRLDVKDKPSGYKGRSNHAKYKTGLRAVPNISHADWRATMPGLKPGTHGSCLVWLDGTPVRDIAVIGLWKYFDEEDWRNADTELVARYAWRVLIPKHELTREGSIEFKIVPVDGSIQPSKIYNTSVTTMIHTPMAARWVEPEKIAGGNGRPVELEPERRAKSNGVWRRYTCCFTNKQRHLESNAPNTEEETGVCVRRV